MRSTPEVSPRVRARIVGVFYLLNVILGIALLIGGRLVVPRDADATAANILAHETMFRAVIVADVFAALCYIGVAALFYDLFKPVSRSVSLLAALIGAAGSIVAAIAGAFELAPLLLLKGAPYLSVFNARQLKALALFFLKMRLEAGDVAFIFFGLYCLHLGYLIYRSTFMPRILGALMAIAGACWLSNSLISLLAPEISRLIGPYLMAGALGEIALTVWLLAAGVDDQRWNEQAAAALA